MPSPQKTAKENREYSIEIRVTFAEKTAIKKSAKDHGLTVSDFSRVRLIDAKPIRRIPDSDREALLQYLAEFNKQGSNINQIARVLNMKGNDEVISYGLIVTIDKAIERHEQATAHIMELLQW
jgi:uncharacterized protein (DUF1778 family)